MTGEELINLVSTLMYGRSRIIEDERILNLKFINMANLDLWPVLANSKRYLRSGLCDIDNNEHRRAHRYVDMGDYFGINIRDIVQSSGIIYFYDSNFDQLGKTGVHNALKFEKDKFSQFNELFIFRKANETKIIKYVYCIECPEINDNDEEIVHIPKIFQHGLASGALYYGTVSTFGFADKIQIQLGVWENLKKKIAYLSLNENEQ